MPFRYKKSVLILSDSKRKYNAFHEIFTRSTFNLLKKVSDSRYMDKWRTSLKKVNLIYISTLYYILSTDIDFVNMFTSSEKILSF